MRTRIASGMTEPGQTPWQPYPQDENILFVDVDTSSAGFEATPTYVAAVHGDSGHFCLVGTGSVYNASKDGFRLYVQQTCGYAVSPRRANELRWCVTWHAVQGVLVDETGVQDAEVARLASALKVDAKGQVGIGGVKRPKAALHVAGDAIVRGLNVTGPVVLELDGAGVDLSRLAPVLVDPDTGRLYRGPVGVTSGAPAGGGGHPAWLPGDAVPGDQHGAAGLDATGAELFLVRVRTEAGLRIGWRRRHEEHAHLPPHDGPLAGMQELLAGHLRWSDEHRDGDLPGDAWPVGHGVDQRVVYAVRARVDGGEYVGELLHGEKIARVHTGSGVVDATSYRVLIR